MEGSEDRRARLKLEASAALAEYTPAKLADSIGFLKWAATGSEKVVTQEEVQ